MLCSCKRGTKLVIEDGFKNIFMPFTLIAILISGIYTVTILFFQKKTELISMAIQPSILLDIEVIA